MPSPDWEESLARWTAAALIDSATAARIRDFESRRPRETVFRWPVILALALGAVLLGAGVLLFVSAHWDDLSPTARMSLVVVLVAMFHVAGALTDERFSNMSIALHTLGTVALGAGIALTGQIFHLSAHWPGGILLWAVGASLAWSVLRHWTQAALAAILIPIWLASEWTFAMDNLGLHDFAPLEVGLFLLALTYFTALGKNNESPLRLALSVAGGLTLFPPAVALWVDKLPGHPGWPYLFAGWTIALGLPLALAVVLRGRGAILNLAGAAWTVIALWITNSAGTDHWIHYPWYAAGAIGLIAWGVYEHRIERINIGIAAFAAVVLAFYFSNIMDKLGRSASLIGLGILFLAGGWTLERMRRRLVAQAKQEPQ